MVSAGVATETARGLAGQVADPEIPVLTIEDLGILRDVVVDDDGNVEVTVTPTYSGCPAMDVIRDEVTRTLREHGYGEVRVRTVLAPAWTTDWMSTEGRAKLTAYGIA
ncbi:MAG TPA: 1,2-phenylacetyl-CoA epoxidase subunit PaaD, partial [Actinomycetes bacterium]|nr:1,2-phenylacetyl-CoA epoxidase subunit PaaD [Actinomycetes bacterium]